MRARIWLVFALLLALAAAQSYAAVFPTVQLSSFDPATSTYVYNITCPSNSSYPFGYFQVDTQMICPPAPNQWFMQGAIVGGVDKLWPKGVFTWDLAGKGAAYWDPISRGTVVPANTAWSGNFVLIVPGSTPTPGIAVTKDGQVLSYAVHNVYVPGPMPVDSTPPVTTIQVEGTQLNSDWFISPVTVTLVATDVDGVVTLTEYSWDEGDWDTWEWIPYNEPFEVADEGIFDLFPRSEDDSGNLEGPPIPMALKIDTTAPIVAGSVAAVPNINGWYSADVQVDYTAVDYVSGLAEPSEADPGVTISFSHTVSSEGSNQSDSGSATDLAGNVGTANVIGLNIDKTAPAVTLVSAPVGGCHLINYENAVILFTAEDTVSGVASVQAVANVIPTEGYALPSAFGLAVSEVSAGVYEATFLPKIPGVYTIVLTATDEAGNTGEISTPVTFSYGGFTVEWLPPISTMDIYWMQDGSTVPVKFRLLDPCNNNAYVSTYPYTVSVVNSAGEVMMAATVPDHDPTTGGYHVNIKTKDANNVNWAVGDYTVVISGPGIWDIVSGPYKAKYGLLLIDKGVAKGSGKR